MSMKKILAVVLVLISALTAVCQVKTSSPARFTLNGYVKDSLSGESIIGATIAVNGKTQGVASNQYGFYSLTLTEGHYEISISHISYQSKIIPLELNSNKPFNFELIPKSAAISEVYVYSKKRDANVKNAQMGKIDLSIEQIKN